MVKEDRKRLIKEIGVMAHGTALREELDLFFEELDDVDAIKSMDEVIGRQWAKKFLKRIRVLLDTGEVTERSKNQYT